MIHFPPVKVYVAVGVTDMRKQINGLSLMVQAELELDPFSGFIFAFCNRTRKIIKLLYWDRTGFCMWQKRLEKGRFKWPDSEEDAMCIDSKELGWLLEGLSLDQKEAFPQLQYSAVF